MLESQHRVASFTYATLPSCNLASETFTPRVQTNQSPFAATFLLQVSGLLGLQSQATSVLKNVKPISVPSPMRADVLGQTDYKAICSNTKNDLLPSEF